ncbi:MAG TPA: glycosyltransferase family 87 protein [Thermoanaerobaculia bacterium]|nr:glycosyltransferase family 87 protein [Thermoanaerobaculia bacterium]
MDRRPPLRSAALLWALAWVLYVLKGLVQPDKPGVYPIFAAAARHWWEGRPLYEPYPGIDIFRYPPTFAVVFTPFAALPDLLGGALWNLTSMVVLWAALRTTARRLLAVDWTPRQEALFLILTLVGTLRGLWSAQTNALLIALVLFATIAVHHRRWWPAATLLAAAVAIKLWPLALVALLASVWPRPLIGRFLAACAAFAAVPFLTRPWGEVLTEYASFHAVLERTAPLRWRGYRDAWTLLEQLGPVDGRFYLALQVGGAALVLLWCHWQRLRLRSEPRLLYAVLAAWVSWQLLLGPATERLTYGIVAPFLAVALLESRGRAQRALAIAAALMVAILGSGEAERALLPLLPMAAAIQPAGVLVFVIWLVVSHWQLPEREASQQAGQRT